jgi:hypothetical protein
MNSILNTIKAISAKLKVRAALPLAVLATLCTVTPDLSATGINWSASAFRPKVTSTGTPLSEKFNLELGSFAAGFTPTAGNVAQWAANWTAADRTLYNPSISYFSATYSFATNEAPFLMGARAYIWGFSCSATGTTEMILISGSSWLWPLGEVVVELPKDWSIATADYTIVGQLGTKQTNPLIIPSEPEFTTAAVVAPLPPLTSDGWRRMVFGDNYDKPAIAGWAQDPDRDGVANAAEYAAGTNPEQYSSAPVVIPSTITVGGQVYFCMEWPRNCRATGITVTPQSTKNFVTWQPNTVDIPSGPLRLVFRCARPIIDPLADPFLRVKVTVP